MWVRPHTDGGIFIRAGLDAEALGRESQPIVCPDGTTRKVFSVGDGVPLVFLPVVNEVNFVWAPQVERFSRDHRVVLFEPVVSRSTPILIRDRADEIAVVLDALGIERAHIVSWSDGGSPAYAFAAGRPERCRSVTFIGLADRFAFGFPLNSLMWFFRHLPIDTFVPEWVAREFIVHFLSGPVAQPEFVRARVRTIPRTARLAKYNLLPLLQDHRPSCYGAVTVPALMVCGDRDKLVSVEQARRMAALLPNCGSVEIVPGGEHFLPYTSGVAVNAMLERFFLSVDSGTFAGEVVIDRRSDEAETPEQRRLDRGTHDDM